MRRLKSPTDNFYIRLPFLDLFLAVLGLSEKQQEDKFRQKDFTCYRVCAISDEEYEGFEKNRGGFVQMEGFLSTSLSEQKALNFFSLRKRNNTLIEIKVRADGLGGQLDWGFASIGYCSSIKGEN